MSSLSDLPDELLLQIFVNVAYDGRQGSQLRGICKRFDQLTTERTLPEKIAKTQFQPYYLFDKALYDNKAYRWTELNAMMANVLPESDRNVLMTAIALIDVMHDIRSITQTFPTSHGASMLRPGLNIARVARTALPLEALALIRYLSIVTHEALQAARHQTSASDLTISTYASTPAVVDWLCRSMTIEARMLRSNYPPTKIYINAHSIAHGYDYKLYIANDVRRQREGAPYDPQDCRSSLILEFAIDALLKQQYQLEPRHDQGEEVSTQNSGDRSEQDNMDEGYTWEFAHLDADVLQNNQSSTRTELVRAYNTHFEVNAEVCSIFQNRWKAQKVLDAIDEEAIVRCLRIHFTEINALASNDIMTVVADELQKLGLDNWPNYTYLDS